MKNSGDKTGARGTSSGPRSDWHVKASCREYTTDEHYDPWDANPADKYPSRTAAAVCGNCPVKRECLLAGLESDRMNQGTPFGVWGGLAPAQRRALVRARNRLGCPACRGQLLISPMGEDWQACASCGVSWRTRKRKVITAGMSQSNPHRSPTM